jgi:hypothetical protein
MAFAKSDPLANCLFCEPLVRNPRNKLVINITLKVEFSALLMYGNNVTSIVMIYKNSKFQKTQLNGCRSNVGQANENSGRG